MKSTNQILTVLERVAGIPGRTAKISLLRTVAGERLREIVDATYNPYHNYYIITKKYKFTPNFSAFDSEFADTEFKQLQHRLDKLKRREITGDLAREYIEDFLAKVPPQYAHWFAKILNRDLKIGVGPDTFLKEFYPKLFPMMNVNLCHVYEGGDLKEKWYSQPKLDGLRCVIAVSQDGQCTAMSRNNKPLNNLEHIFAELLAGKERGYVLDGEIMGPNWNETISITQMDAISPKARKLKFFAFDLIRMKDWEDQKCGPLSCLGGRCYALWQLVKALPRRDYIQPLAFDTLVQTEAEITAAMTKHIEEGYEGSVLKDPESLYAFKRTNTWLKAKPEHEADLEIYGIEPGEGKYAGMLGAIRVRGEIEYKKKTVKIDTRVGSGFSDKQRRDFMTMGKRLNGLLAEIKFQEVAERMEAGKRGDVFALRFPVFMRLRTDKKDLK